MASIPGGVPVAGFISPTDTTDTFPVTAEDYNKGGYRAVADNTARDAIPAPRRKEGMWVFTTATGKHWLLNSDLVTWTERSFTGTGLSSVSVDNITITGDGTGGNPLVAHAGITSVHTDTTLTGDGTVGSPLHVVPQAVVVDGTTVTGTGLTGSPLVAHSGLSSVTTDATLTGAGTAGSPLSAVFPTIHVDGTTVAGAGTVGSPLSAIAQAVVVDGTTVTGTGLAGSPLVAHSGLTTVSTDTTLTGNGTAGSPLHAVIPAQTATTTSVVATGFGGNILTTGVDTDVQTALGHIETSALNASKVGPHINSLTAKTTPVDADMVSVMDSAAANAEKKLSWSNIKTTLKSYFDTVYAVAGAYLTAVTTDATLTGSGTAGSPLHAVPQAVIVDNTTITGTGLTGSPLVSHSGLSAVSTDTTLTGNGTAGSPLHAVIPAQTATTTSVDTTAFTSNILTTAETTVQSALTKIDNTAVSLAGLPVALNKSVGYSIANFVKNPTGDLSLTNNVTVGAGVVAPSAAPTPLVGVQSFRLTGVATAGATTYWSWNLNAIDSFFIGKPLSVVVKTSASVASTFKMSVYNITDSTELTETVVTIPAGSYTAKSFFIPVSGKSYGLRITQIVNGTNTCDVDDLYVGDVPVRFGQAMTDWQQYTPVFSGQGSATFSTNNCWWRRVGDSVEILGHLISNASGSGSSNFVVGLPTGLNTNTSIALALVGYMDGYNVNGAAAEVLYPLVVTGTTGFLFYTGTAIVTGALIGNPATIRINARLPIVGWSSNIQLADRAVEEYVSNFQNSNSSSDTTSFAYGPAGSLIPNGGTGTNYIRRCQFTYPYQSTDTLILEVDQGTGYWVASDKKLSAFITQASGTYGISMAPTSSYVDVTFANGGARAVAGTFGAAGDAWTNYATWRWRVRKVSSGAQVGFPISTANVLGRTDGSTPGTGYIGERVLAQSTTGTAASGNAVRGVATLSIPGAGNWEIKATVVTPWGGASGGASIILSTTSASSSTFSQSGAPNNAGYSDIAMCTGQGNTTLGVIPGATGIFTGPATVYLNVYSANTVAASNIIYTIEAVRRV